MSRIPAGSHDGLETDEVLDPQLSYELANEVSRDDHEDTYGDDIWESEDMQPVMQEGHSLDSFSEYHPKEVLEKKNSPYRDEQVSMAQRSYPSESPFGSASSLNSMESPIPLQSSTLLWDPSVKEVDDILHNEDFHDGRDFNVFTLRGFVNILTLILLSCGLLMLFIGYPILSAVDVEKQRKKEEA
ncbi:plasma membrane-actinomyosin ring linker protein Sbg1 [Schizosaccharomyces osmophilus]|uniref:Plasma membrane-actinomyosin ring linker protein Sbg1 n=1 Tax=Schizosaccharomyces osmophilus TaxID=2545709 RepID=A0AAF0AVH2_9SCHI|nr:plasma membrane-actinomyosin ring linker protein Sbg1 [Schizosaccharomyces osmophilus]WBW72438.1 plasma membrane-actinomyosin ring linker protein Sbg1 [Schizosaccharomyces osmophilus]